MSVKIFFCYAREDEALLNKLKAQLRPLHRQGLIDVWHDRDITAGTEWEQEISDRLNAAQIILLLISPDFMDSDYCYGVEMKRALERHKKGEATVIPVILRPVYWQGVLGKLQALPTDGKPVIDSSWHNLDNAFFNVAEGIRQVITQQLLARKISLFGYETDGGTKSVLWKNPLSFSPDENFSAWWSMRRDITNEEIVNRIWAKVSNVGNYWTVHFLPGGHLIERLLSDPSRQSKGVWKLIDGILRIKIEEYEIDIFANREYSTYSAIEFEGDQKEPCAYHVFFPFHEVNAKHWDLDDVPGLVVQIFEQVLERKAGWRAYILFGSLLHRGEISVRDAIKLLGLSPEYRERFINGLEIDEVIELFYQHFLSRKADNDGKPHYSKKVREVGFDAVLVQIIESPEYTEDFGEDHVPARDWLETNVSTIRIGLSSPRPKATVRESPISARGRVEGLPDNGRYTIVGFIITDIAYEQARAPVNKDGSWKIDKIYLSTTSQRIFFKIIDESNELIAESKEITIFKS